MCWMFSSIVCICWWSQSTSLSSASCGLSGNTPESKDRNPPITVQPARYTLEGLSCIVRSLTVWEQARWPFTPTSSDVLHPLLSSNPFRTRSFPFSTHVNPTHISMALIVNVFSTTMAKNMSLALNMQYISSCPTSSDSKILALIGMEF